MPIAVRSTTGAAPDSEGDLIGVEPIGLSGEVSLRGLREAERIREALLAHGPSGLRIEGDEVFHPVNRSATAS